MSTLVHNLPIPEPVDSAGEPVTAISLDARSHEGAGVTEGRVMKAEWLKLRTVRSTRMSIGAAVLVAVGLGAIFTYAGVGRGPRDVVDSTSLSLAGFRMSQLIIGVVGVLLVSAEYSTGLIRTTFSTVRSRLSVVRAKAAVYGSLLAVLATVSSFAAFFIGQSLYDGTTASIGDPGVLRVVIATAAYTVVVGLLGVALGFLLRSTAGAIGVLFGSLLLLPALVGLLPWGWAETLTKLLPSNAGEAITSLNGSSDLLSVRSGAIVLVLWVAGLLTAAGVAVMRRDA